MQMTTHPFSSRARPVIDATYNFFSPIFVLKVVLPDFTSTGSLSAVTKCLLGLFCEGMGGGKGGAGAAAVARGWWLGIKILPIVLLRNPDAFSNRRHCVLKWSLCSNVVL